MTAANPAGTSIVLVHPEIPGNTGSVGRTCVALDLELVLIKPYGFELTDARVKRAGLDYWQHLRLTEYDSWDAFMADRRPRTEQLFMFEDDGQQSFYEPDYPDDAYLVFGCETKGLPLEVRDVYREREFFLPMRSPHIRSLNLSNTVTAVAYHVLKGALST